MGAHRLLTHLHLVQREEIGVLRKFDDNGARELGQVAGRGDLALVMEAVDICKPRPGHAEPLRRLIHAGDERGLAAGNRLGDHYGDVVGGLHDENLERDVECDRTSEREAEFGGCSWVFCPCFPPYK